MLLPVACLPAYAQSSPQQIVNTASAQWDIGAERITVNSNTVQFTVEQRVPETGITLYRLSRDPGATTHALPPTMCSGTSGRTPMALGGPYADTQNAAASLLVTTTIRAGEPLVIGLTAPTKNINPMAIDTFEAVIATSNGDRERISFTEDAPNSGRFVAFINTKAIPPTPSAGDCALSVNPGDTINVELDDASSGLAVGQADVEILVDPFGLTFDSGDGAPVDGSRVTIVDAATGQPAEVFGDDGLSVFRRPCPKRP